MDKMVSQYKDLIEKLTENYLRDYINKIKEISLSIKSVKDINDAIWQTIYYILLR